MFLIRRLQDTPVLSDLINDRQENVFYKRLGTKLEDRAGLENKIKIRNRNFGLFTTSNEASI